MLQMICADTRKAREVACVIAAKRMHSRGIVACHIASLLRVRCKSVRIFSLSVLVNCDSKAAMAATKSALDFVAFMTEKNALLALHAGICCMFERHLKETRSKERDLIYDVKDLFTFIDDLPELSALVCVFTFT